MPEGVELQKLSHRHQAIADIIIANPKITQKEIAGEVGMTENWVSTIMRSDLFQSYLAQRRAQFEERLLDRKIEVQSKALEVGYKGLMKAEEALDADEADPVETFSKALQAAGIGRSGAAGGEGSQQTNIQNNYYTATPDELANARRIMQNRAQEIQHQRGGEESGEEQEPNNPSG